jgi:transposase
MAIPRSGGGARSPVCSTPISRTCARLAAGCADGLQLWRELRDQGYPGSKKRIAVWLRQQRRTPAPTAPQKYGGPGSDQPSGRPQPTGHRPWERQPSSRSVSFFLLRDPGSLEAEEQRALQRIQESWEDVAVGYALLQEFLQMMRERRGGELAGWLERAKASKFVDIENFAAGIQRDQAAVAGGLGEEWNNGQLEGQVNRLKLLKRSMYGRANFALLRRRVLYAT